MKKRFLENCPLWNRSGALLFTACSSKAAKAVEKSNLARNT